MKPQNELALIVGYYLSRMNKEGYSVLGYKTFSEATIKIGEILGVKKNTIKNMRDEFDPYHQNDRVGWLRELRGSRLKILKTFQETDDETLLEIVKEILNNKEFEKTEEYKDIHSLFNEKEHDKIKTNNPIFILRGPTGRAAEIFFIEYFKNTGLPISGELIDCRDLGVGYDFEIQNNEGKLFVEVKGLASNDGGVLFTNKEWQTALNYREKYCLIIVKNVSSTPEIKIIQDPASQFNPKKNIRTVLQVSWSLSGKNLN